MTAERRAGTGEFEDLVRPEVHGAFRAALLLCGDWQQAEDLVQSVLAHFFAAGRWHQVDHVQAYLRRAVTHEFLSSRRRRASTELVVADVADQPHDAAADVDLADRVDLFRALGQLSRADRAVVVLRYWEDLSVAEVSALLETTPGAVRTRSARALVRLRHLLEPASTAAPAGSATHTPIAERNLR